MEEKENTENAEMGKRKHSHDTKIVIKYYYERIRQNTRNFLKWMGLSVLTGLVVGGASAVFAGCIKAATRPVKTESPIHFRKFLVFCRILS